MKIFLPFFILTLFLLVPSQEQTVQFNEDQVFIWNVGQGQMITYLTPTHCHHIDMGGEKFPQKKLFSLCKDKKNDVRYTHYDWDHINFSIQTKNIFPSLCRIPLGPLPSLSRKKSKMILSLPSCTYENPSEIQWINVTEKFPEQIKNSNDSSLIFIIKNKILIPGDSSSKMERYWASLVPSSIQILITGHHGSKSSTSSFLLGYLPKLKLAISSARFKRYGHPHLSTQRRLNKKGVLSIQTEHKGHIRLELSSLPRYFIF